MIDFTTSQRYHTEPQPFIVRFCAYQILGLVPHLTDEPVPLGWDADFTTDIGDSILITPGQFIDALIELKRKQDEK